MVYVTAAKPFHCFLLVTGCQGAEALLNVAIVGVNQHDFARFGIFQFDESHLGKGSTVEARR